VSEPIPLSERRPPPGEFVLAFCGRWIVARTDPASKPRSEDWLFPHAVKSSPTHWLPLPPDPPRP
jgi:hypothetical protein